MFEFIIHGFCPTAWKEISRNRRYAFDDDVDMPTVEVETNSEMGSRDILWVHFFGSSQKHNGAAGGIKIFFLDTPEFGLDWCGLRRAFPTALPDAVDKVWQISKTPGHMRVLVNGKEVLNIESEGICRLSHSPEIWNLPVSAVMIHSDDTASDRYRFF